MTKTIVDQPILHDQFLASRRQHVLMLTIHGIHQWQVVPGLPDTGGQNVFVNQFSQALADQGFKITIANRGGYPHPVSGEARLGLHYKDAYQRILYLEDGLQQFVRKEDMAEHIPELVACLQEKLDARQTPVDLILSHYWDAGKVGAGYRQNLPSPVPHIWIPHSLGEIKKKNTSPEQWDNLRIDQRIHNEQHLLQVVDGVGSTSSRIQTSLSEDYGYSGPVLWLPPCVDPERYHPRQVGKDDPIWEFLSQRTQLTPEEVRRCKIVSEISRTDTTKRKDVLIEAFARVHRRFPDSLLVVAIDEHQKALAGKLKDLIEARQIGSHTAVVGSIWEWLPALYAVTDVYCTPSIMEGFGMSAQEAAASGAPVVSSDKVPFASEYLLDQPVRELHPQGGPGQPIRVGQGAVVVPADDVAGFTYALELLLHDSAMRRKMGQRALQITIPKFTWDSVVREFLQALNAMTEGPEIS
jgi:D-inositol-3-phosphate glycosyltransferase